MKNFKLNNVFKLAGILSLVLQSLAGYSAELQNVTGFISINSSPSLKGKRLITDQNFRFSNEIGFATHKGDAQALVSMQSIHDSVALGSQINILSQYLLVNSEGFLVNVIGGGNYTHYAENNASFQQVRAYLGLQLDTQFKYLNGYLYSGVKGNVLVGTHFWDSATEAVFKTHLDVNLIGVQVSLTEKSHMGVELQTSLEVVRLTGSLSEASYLSIIPKPTLYAQGEVAPGSNVRVETGFMYFNSNTQTFEGDLKASASPFIKLNTQIFL